ncbi:hypothetical protein ABPG77_007442 [Micractinium sp. CCAP 211/92]
MELRSQIEELKERMEEMQAQLVQLNDRARDRAVSLASAVKAAGSGDAAPLEQLQHQQDEQLELDERSWDSVMDSFTQLMSKGYIASTEKIRDRLLITEWELNRKSVAMRRGVAHFELHCAGAKVELPYEVLSQLYEDPGSLEIIQDPHLRMQARASINQAVDEEYVKVYSHCTAEAQKLAQQFSNTEFISKVLPESGLLDALKKVVPMALKMVV